MKLQYLPRRKTRCWPGIFLITTLSSTLLAQQNEENENIHELSPFRVESSNDVGYYAENTLAGSRLNTNISDLASSVTVITRQQLDDTASLDINDVFRYEANTEGASTYTPGVLTFRNDGVADTIAGVTAGNTGIAQTSATANRVRGLGVPSSAINYYPAISQVPFDSYNIQSLEISRGPNSMLFGMGSPAGIVNQTTAQAIIGSDRHTLSLRIDDRKSHRASFTFNRNIIDDKLAIYGAILFDQQRFERKPSYDNTERQYAAVTYRPFKKTLITANIENYSNENRRPNSLTPRDFVTEWRQAGQPVYDPVTKRITKLSTGEQIGPYILSADSPFAGQVVDYIQSRPDYNATLWNPANNTYNGVSIYGEAALTNTNSILYVPGIAWQHQARSVMQISGGQLQNWFQPLGNQRYRTEWGIPGNPSANAPLYPEMAAIWANPTAADMFNRYTTLSNAWTQIGSDIGNYKYPGVSDKSIYDWSKINTSQMNFGEQDNVNYNIEFEQELTRNLHFSAGWFRQDFKSVSNYSVAQLNVATVFVDTNQRLPDGSVNPYFGQVYHEDSDPDQFINKEVHDHLRAMIAYTPDFTEKDGWMQWLGRHQILGLASYQDSMQQFHRQRLHYVDGEMAAQYRYMANQNDDADGNPTGWNRQTTSVRRLYYLSNPGDPFGNVTRAPGEWNHRSFNGDIQVYDYAAGQFDDWNVTTDFIDFNAHTARHQRKLESLSAGITSYFWEDRLVTTFGIRRDDYKARSTTDAAIIDADGNTVEDAMPNKDKWVDGVYQVDTIFNRWNRWDEISGNTSTMGGVLRPFRNWNSIEERANNGSIWWEFVRDFGISYNESDNFNAPTAAQVDAFGRALPKPTGEGKDFGIQFSLFKNKLFARINWFEASNQNERTNPGSSINRLTENIDTTLFRNWARTIALINMGHDPRQSGFGENLSTADEDSVQAAAEDIWQQSYTYYQDVGSIYATRNAEAKGTEVQVIYNPTPNWTIKFTGSKQKTTYTNVLKEFDDWYAHRSPVWDNARAADYLLPQYQDLATYTSSGGREVDLTTFWEGYGYRTEVRLDEPNGYVDARTYYDGLVAPQYALASDLEGQAAPGQREYRASILTNYLFIEGPLSGFSVGGSLRWEDEAIIGYYGKSSGNNPNPNFLDLSDTSRPIYDSDNWYTDLWVGYTRQIFNDSVRMKLQLNVVDVFEDGGLKTVAVNYDGSPAGYRIVDSRQFIFTASFDF